jgi:hypothetical protein
MRTRIKYIFLLIALMTSAMRTMAQEVIVNVTPVQQVLPPQVMLYLSNPGK